MTRRLWPSSVTYPAGADAEVQAGLRAAERLAQEIVQTEGILTNELGDLGRRNRQQLAPVGHRAQHPFGTKAPQRFVQRSVAEQEQLAVGEPSEIARAIDDAGVDAADLGRRPQPLDPGVDLVGVVGNGVAFGRREDDIQLIQAAEPRQECPERLENAPIVRQQRQHVGVERQALHAGERDQRGAEHRDDDQRAPAVRPADDCRDEGIH